MCLNVFIKTTNHSVILVYISVYSSLKIYLVNLTVKIYSIFIKLWKNSYVFINSYCFILKLLFGQLVLPLAQSWSSRRNRNSQCVRMIETYIRKASGTWLKKFHYYCFELVIIVLTLLRWNGWMLFSTGIYALCLLIKLHIMNEQRFSHSFAVIKFTLLLIKSLNLDLRNRKH